VLRAAKAVEDAGVPAVTIVSSGFMAQARAIRKAIGAPDLQIAEYPGVIPLDSPEQFTEKVRTVLLESVLQHLRTEVVETESAVEPFPEDIVFRGSLDEVQEAFHAREWSDGAAIVPPTRERVEAFLRWTDYDRNKVLGVLAPEYREASVLSVAVNGVMAGCRPEYMPVLIAAIEAICDPHFRIEDAGSTPGWEPMIVVSGAIVEQLGFNTEVASMRVGRRANTSIGRFLRLYFRNVAGLRPGGTDKGSIGLGFNVAMAENEKAVGELGWPTYREDRGFARGDSVVTVRSVLAISPPVYSAGTDPKDLAWPLVNNLAGTTWGWFITGLYFNQWHPLILMSPSVAGGFARAGWGKNDIRKFLFDQARIDAGTLERYSEAVFGNRIVISELAKRAKFDPLFTSSQDLARQVPMLLNEACTDIVVGGDPARNQSKIYLNNQEQGAPVSRKIALPAGWDGRIAAAARG
jgi:hypothetical protein